MRRAQQMSKRLAATIAMGALVLFIPSGIGAQDWAKVSIEIVRQVENPVPILAVNCPGKGTLSAGVGVGPGGQMTAGCSATLRNDSGKELRSVFVRYELIDANEKGLFYGVAGVGVEIPLAKAKGTQRFLPGKEIVIPQFGNTIADVALLRVQVEAVEFADGSTWGKVDSFMVRQFRSSSAGRRLVVEAVKAAYAKGGVEAAFEELAKFEGDAYWQGMTGQSMEEVRGMRAGARSAISRLRKLREQMGAEAALREFGIT